MADAVIPGPPTAAPLSVALHRYAEGCTEASFTWEQDRWTAGRRPTAMPRSATALMHVADLSGIEQLTTLLREAPEVRLFLRLDPTDSAGSRSRLADAVGWLESRGAVLFSVDDREGGWWRGWRRADTETGAVYACVGVAPHAIAAVAHNGDLGGASRAHVEMAVQLQRRGHLVHTLTPGWSARTLPDELRTAGIATSPHNCHWWASPSTAGDWAQAGTGVTELAAQLARIGPDVVVTETAVIPGGALAARDLGVPHIWMLHERIDPAYGLHAPCPPADLGAAIAELSTAVVANSHFVAGYFFQDPRACHVAAPMSVPQFDALAAAHATGRDTGPAGSPAEPRPFTVAVIGQVSEAKGQADLVRAVRVLVDRGHRIRVRVFGSGDPEAMGRLRAEIRSSRLEAEVGLEGHRKDALDELRGCDAVAVPSWAEAFGRVPVEAVASGCPVVYANAGGMAEYMVDGVTGLAFEPRNPTALADALERLAVDPALGQLLVAQGRAHLRAWLGDHDAATTITQICERIRSRPPHALTWLDTASIAMRRADALECAERTSSLPAWRAAGLAPSLAAFQGSRARNTSLERLLDGWIGTPGRRRRRIAVASARGLGRAGVALPRRIRAALLVAGLDPSLDPWLVEGLLDQAWYRAEHGLAPAADALLDFAEHGLPADAPPNQFISPAWYLQRNPDAAASGIGAVRHYLAIGCFQGRAPGPDFDPERYLRHNPDVAASDLPPLVHYLQHGRDEGRRLW